MRTFPPMACAILILSQILTPAFLLATDTPPLEWRLATRDVYVEGRLDPTVRVYSCRDARLMALLRDDWEQAILAHFDGGVTTAPATAFTFQRHGTRAESMAFDLPKTATAKDSLTEVGDVGYLLRAQGKTLLITAHQGQAGALSQEELWRIAPLWRQLKDAYEPDQEAVSALRSITDEVELEVAFGTWCGDSRRDVPALLRTLEEADNPNITLRLVGLARGFEEPGHYIRRNKLTNVPTIMVLEKGTEIGRYVENPRGEKVESDLVEILTGKPYQATTVRPGEMRLLAHGKYRYLKQGREVGHETWRLFAREDGDRQLHCRLTTDTGESETRQRLNAERHSTFLEVTRREGENISRSRLSIDEDGYLSATTRGSNTGIIRQSLQLPAGALLAGPGFAAGALGQAIAKEGKAPIFRLGGVGQPAAGELLQATFEVGPEDVIDTPAGKFSARMLRRQEGDQTSILWVHHDLGLPVAGQRGELQFESLDLHIVGEL